MQVQSNGRVRRTEEEWRELLFRWRKSGLSAREFCRQESLQSSSFQRWQRHLSVGSSRSDFVTMVPSSPALPSTPSWSLEVTLPNGIKLRFQG